MKNKKATINPVLDDNKCFQYTATVALNHEETRNHPQSDDDAGAIDATRSYLAGASLPCIIIL